MNVQVAIGLSEGLLLYSLDEWRQSALPNEVASAESQIQPTAPAIFVGQRLPPVLSRPLQQIRNHVHLVFGLEVESPLNLTE